VIDPSRLQVVASVPIGDLVRVKVGNHARVIVPGLESPEDETVLSRPAAVDPAGVAADVRISLRVMTTLGVGTPVRVEIVAERRPDALAVPIEAVMHEGEDTFVMVAGPDAKAHKRQVALGLSTPALVEILGGVTAGDRVIVQGQQGLPDGAAIVVEK
jgi:multidrug efflux pump subunit AcrA (membrane-fusion protein)